jgi:hypothetical protein
LKEITIDAQALARLSSKYQSLLTLPGACCLLGDTQASDPKTHPITNDLKSTSFYPPWQVKQWRQLRENFQKILLRNVAQVSSVLGFPLFFQKKETRLYILF